MATPDIVRSTAAETELSEFERLRRFILYHLGRFTLGLVRVNDPRQRDGIIASLADVLAAEGVQLVRVDLANRHPATLREALQSDPGARTALAEPDRAALAIVGLEHLIETEGDGAGRPPFAAALNLERDALRQALPLPIILFLTDHAMDRLDLTAPDFFDWYSGIFRFRPAQMPHASMAVPSEAPAQLRYEPAVEDEESSLAPETVAERLDLLEERRLELAQAGTEARQRLAQVLKEMGELYAGLPEFHNRQLAVSYLSQAAEIFHEEEQRGDEAKTLENLGTVHYWIDDYKRATHCYEAALSLYQKIGNRLGKAHCIRGLGDVHHMLAEYEAARQRYEAALPLYWEIGNRLGEANCIRRLGDVHMGLAEYGAAQRQYETALSLYQEIGNRLGEANCITTLGDVHQLLAEYRVAQERYELALSLYQEIGNRLGKAHCIRRLGDVHMRLAEYGGAREQYEAALSIYREIGARLGEANCVTSLGNVYMGLAEYGGARERYEAALSIYREIGNRLGEANCIKSLGNVHMGLAEYGAAREQYEAALSIYREIGARLGEANCIRSVGDVHQMLDEHGAARERYEAALPIYQEMGDRLEEANTYTAFGELELAEEAYAAAREWFERALTIYRQIGDRHWQTYVALHLAEALLELNETATAVQVLESGARLARTIEGQPNLQPILSLLDAILQAQNKA